MMTDRQRKSAAQVLFDLDFTPGCEIKDCKRPASRALAHPGVERREEQHLVCLPCAQEIRKRLRAAEGGETFWCSLCGVRGLLPSVTLINHLPTP